MLSRAKLALFSVVFGVAAGVPSKLAGQTESQTDAHAVYQLTFDFFFFDELLSDLADESPEPPSVLVVNDTTADVLNRIMLQDLGTRLVPMLRYLFPAADPDLAARFAEALQLRIRPDLPNLPVPTVFLSTARADSIFEDGGPGGRGWDTFRRLYPGAHGITEVSPVAFNVPVNQALVYIGTQRDYLDGGGFFLFLERRDGVWRLIAHQQIWVS